MNEKTPSTKLACPRCRQTQTKPGRGLLLSKRRSVRPGKTEPVDAGLRQCLPRSNVPKLQTWICINCGCLFDGLGKPRFPNGWDGRLSGKPDYPVMKPDTRGVASRSPSTDGGSNESEK